MALRSICTTIAILAGISVQLSHQTEIQFSHKDCTFLIKENPESIDLLSIGKSKSDPSLKVLPTVEKKPGFEKGWTILKVRLSSSVDRSRLFLQKQDSSVTDSGNQLYFYEVSSAWKSAGKLLSWLYLIMSGILWVLGVKQYYLLIRNAQLFFLINLLCMKSSPSKLFYLLDSFSVTLFNVISNPVEIPQTSKVNCQPAVHFLVQGMSCHTYNSLKDYVLGVLIFAAISAFLHVNKFSHLAFWADWKASVNFRVLLFAVMPFTLTAAFLNSTAGLSNSVLSLGFLFGLSLLAVYGYLFVWLFKLWKSDDVELIHFLKFYSFSRSELSNYDSRSNRIAFAVLAEQVKSFLIAVIVGLFSNSPNGQPAAIMLIYLSNALIVLFLRPYKFILQTLFVAVSDICMFMVFALLLDASRRFESLSMADLEDGLGKACVAFFIIPYCLTILLFGLPILKGKDVDSNVLPTEARVDTGANLITKGKDSSLESDSDLKQNEFEKNDPVADSRPVQAELTEPSKFKFVDDSERIKLKEFKEATDSPPIIQNEAMISNILKLRESNPDLPEEDHPKEHHKHSSGRTKETKEKSTVHDIDDSAKQREDIFSDAAPSRQQNHLPSLVKPKKLVLKTVESDFDGM